MMLKSRVQIQIPNPCGENWDAMTVVEKGRFCGSCARVLTDFSKMSDKEIINHLSKNGKVCGRFRNDQLNRQLYTGKENRNYFLRWSLGALLGLGIGNSVQAQGQPENKISVCSTSRTDTLNKKRVIQGVVKDTANNPLPNSTIALYYNRNAEPRFGVADSNGLFKFTLSDSVKIDSIKVYFIGYKTEVIYEVKDYSEILLESILLQPHIIGFVVETSKHRFKRKVRSFFRRIFE